jgi:nitrous oxide reductase accessory protein NosL
MQTTTSRLLIPLVLLFSLLLATGASGEPLENMPKPDPKYTCPVCGMFVALYPEWIGTALFKDGHADHFDGAKDMFKYLLDMKKWAGDRKAEAITEIGVTEYYSLALIDARTAFYVSGSDVLGPVGHELIPREAEEDAEEFLKDHKGKRIIKFEDVTLEMLTGLDNGKFE